MVMHFRVSDERKKEKKLSIYAPKTFYANVKNPSVENKLLAELET